MGRNQTSTAVKIASELPPPLDADPRLRLNRWRFAALALASFAAGVVIAVRTTPAPRRRDQVRRCGHSRRCATPGHDPRTAAACAGAAGRHRHAAHVSNLATEMRLCEATFDPATARAVKPEMIATCWCQPHDQRHAQAAIALVKPRDRAGVCRACAKLGVVLR